MKKRGQLTLFIILGIIILAIIALTVYFISPDILVLEESTLSAEAQQVVDLVQDCAEDSTLTALTNIGYTGGYYTLPETSLSDDTVELPYYYYDGENLMPSLDTIEEEIGEYAGALIEYCVGTEISLLYDLEFIDNQVEISVEQYAVEGTVDFPISLSLEDTTYFLDEPYVLDVPVPLGKIYDVAENIVEHDIENPDIYDLNYYLEQNLSSIKYVPYGEGNLIYLLEEEVVEEDSPYIFMFASYFPVNESYSDFNLTQYLEGAI